MGVGMSIAARWVPILERGGFSPIPFFYVMGGSLVFLFLTWHIPSVASAMMVGAVHLSLADVYYPLMLAGRAGGVALGAAGAVMSFGRWGSGRLAEWTPMHTGGRGGPSGAAGGSQPSPPSAGPSGPGSAPIPRPPRSRAREGAPTESADHPGVRHNGEAVRDQALGPPPMVAAPREMNARRPPTHLPHLQERITVVARRLLLQHRLWSSVAGTEPATPSNTPVVSSPHR